MEKIRDIQNTVLKKIQQGELSIRPRSHFVLRVVLISVLAAITLALSVFTLSFAFFSIHESGEQFLLGFGHRGILTFIALFPWKTFILVILLLVLVEWLMRYFKFGYRKSILPVFVGLFFASALAGILITATPIHSALLDRANKGELGFLDKIYENVHALHEDKGVFRGHVISIDMGNFTLSHDDFDHDADDGTRVVVPPSGYSLSAIHIGDYVYVAGPIDGDTIHAYGISVFQRNN